MKQPTTTFMGVGTPGRMNLEWEQQLHFLKGLVSFSGTETLIFHNSPVKNFSFPLQKSKIYFKEYRGEDLSRWDLLQLINKWFIVIVISDCLAITGSFFKLLIDSRVSKNILTILKAVCQAFDWMIWTIQRIGNLNGC